MAAGSYTNSGGTQLTLAEAWNGTSWTIQTTPNPSGATSTNLSGVSCPTPSSCLAAGSYTNSGGTQLTLAEAWNGTNWTIQTTPNPSGATSTNLSGVSCPTPSSCLAAGSYTNSAGTQLTLAEAWNGTNWTIQTTPNPSGANSTNLSGVSCPTPSSCLAAGSYTNSAGTQLTLAEAWNGTNWAIQTTPNPSGATSTNLSGVSCPTPSSCLAAGSYTDSAGSQVTLAEAWNGTNWAIQITRSPAGQYFSRLAAESCSATTACTAVGSSLDFNTGTQQTLAEAWNGTHWAIQKTPNPSGATSSNLAGISCATTTICMAVGSYYTAAGTQQTLAEAWNGTHWAIQKTPNPSGATSSNLAGISCATTTICVAVGSYYTAAGTQQTLAEAWNGTHWAIQKTPNPSGATSSNLAGISCATTTICMAVGSYTGSTGTRSGLAEIWNGTGWTRQPTGQATGSTYSQLSGVSCVSATFCTAVGLYSSSAKVVETLAEIWNGTGWTIRSTPEATGAQSSQLAAISCPTAVACIAVGSYLNSSPTEVTLAEVWNGTSWTAQSTPDPTGAIYSQLSGVSCPVANTCERGRILVNGANSGRLHRLTGSLHPPDGIACRSGRRDRVWRGKGLARLT